MLSIIMLIEVVRPIIVEMTQVAIDSIVETTEGDFELCLVIHAERNCPIITPKQAKVLRNKKRLSIAEGYNFGVAGSKGDIFCFVHNDVIIPCHGWNKIMEHVAREGNIAFPMTDESESQCEMRGVPQNEPWHPSSSCYMLSRELWDKLGGLDENFKLMHGEDIDLFKRAQKLGRKLVRCDPRVIHHRGVTRSFLDDAGNSSFFSNWHLFNLKHQTEPGEHVPLPRVSETPDIRLSDIDKTIKTIGKPTQKQIQKKEQLETFRKNNWPALNLGCGQQPEVFAINCDMHEKDVDVMLDARNMPIKSGSVGMIENNQLLEHIEFGLTESAISEWARCLKDNGLLVISVPNMERILRMEKPDFMPDDAWWRSIQWMIYGSQEREGQYHKACFTPGSLKAILEKHDFIINDEDIWLGFPHRPTPSFTIIARKKEEKSKWVS